MKTRVVCSKEGVIIKEKRKLITDYISKCPFIEMFEIINIDEETARIDIAFDDEYWADKNKKIK